MSSHSVPAIQLDNTTQVANFLFASQVAVERGVRKFMMISGTLLRSAVDITEAGLRKLLQLVIVTLRAVGNEGFYFVKHCLTPMVEFLQGVEVFANINKLYRGWSVLDGAKKFTIINGIMAGIIGVGMLIENYKIFDITAAIGKIPVIGPALTSMHGFFYMNIFAILAAFGSIYSDARSIRAKGGEQGELRQVYKLMKDITTTLNEYNRRCKYKSKEFAEAHFDSKKREEYTLNVAKLAAWNAKAKGANIQDAVNIVLGRRSNNGAGNLYGSPVALQPTALPPVVEALSSPTSARPAEADMKTLDAVAPASTPEASAPKDTLFERKIKLIMLVTDAQAKAFTAAEVQLKKLQQGAVQRTEAELKKLETSKTVLQDQLKDVKKTLGKGDGIGVMPPNTPAQATQANVQPETPRRLTVDMAVNNEREQQKQLATQREREIREAQAKENEPNLEKAIDVIHKKIEGLQDKIDAAPEHDGVVEIARLVNAKALSQMQAIADVHQKYADAAVGDAKKAAKADLKLESQALSKMTDKYDFLEHNVTVEIRKPWLGIVSNVFKITMLTLFSISMATGIATIAFNSPWMFPLLATVTLTAYAKVYTEFSKYDEEQDIVPLMDLAELRQFHNASLAAAAA